MSDQELRVEALRTVAAASKSATAAELTALADACLAGFIRPVEAVANCYKALCVGLEDVGPVGSALFAVRVLALYRADWRNSF